MPPNLQRGRGRAEPLSCQSCRSKKLKCNRVQPCANCIARGITCHFLIPPPRLADTATSTTQSKAELSERIKRLEAIIAQHCVLDEGHLAKQSELTPSTSATGSEIDHKRDQDSRLLENAGTREDSVLPPLSHSLVFRIHGLPETSDTRAARQSQATSSEVGSQNDVTVTFPSYKTAVLLFQSYECNVDHMCRVLHIPTARSLMQSLYLRLNRSLPITPGQAALVLSIFAAAAFFYNPSYESKLATSEEDAVQLSQDLGRAALDVLDYSTRITSGTLEDAQAYIILSKFAFHLDGNSARSRRLLTAAASIAKDLRLHRLDAAAEHAAAEKTNARILIDHEVKRRVFWYITSTDWLLSSVSGPQEGVYFIHPSHISVKLPKDCTDDELVLGEGEDLTNDIMMGPRPTGLTYARERIRLAHICREMVDMLPPETSQRMQVPYEQILALDKKLVDFISSLPFWLRLDPESLEQTKPLETMYPNIVLLRGCIIRAAHSRRCKLHQTYLMRQSSDPRYAYSRRACIESARAVIPFYDDIAAEDDCRSTTAQMSTAVHYMHLALVVLTMDLCFNKDEADHAEIMTDVKAALHIFESNRHFSPLADLLLITFGRMLQKYGVYPSVPTTSAVNPFGEFDSAPQPALDRADDEMQFVQLGMDSQDTSIALDVSFDEFWQQAMEAEPNIDLLAWDKVFSDIDSQPL